MKQQWPEMKAKLEALSSKLQLDAFPPGTAIPIGTRKAEHALHELAHAYLLGWRPLQHLNAFFTVTRKAASREPTTRSARGTWTYMDFGLSNRIAMRLRRLHYASDGATTGSYTLTDAHEMCAVAVVYRLLCQMHAAPDKETAAVWMTCVQKTKNVRQPDEWEDYVNHVGVLWCADAIVADLEQV